MIAVFPDALIVSLVVQAIFFFLAYLRKTDKLTDITYSLTFIILVTTTGSWVRPETVQYCLRLAVYLWALRLGIYLLIRIVKIRSDRRFDRIRNNFWKFGGFWLLQGISVWLIVLPVLVILSKPPLRPGVISVVGGIVWSIGLAIETVADWQKFHFKNRRENQGRWIQTGLWKWSRHPNYFGEMMLWWGLAGAAAPYFTGADWLSLCGPAFLTFLLMRVSGIPPLEKKADDKYGQQTGYQKYRQETSLVIPLPPGLLAKWKKTL